MIHGPERKDGGLRNASQTFAWAPCVAVVCRSLPSALCTSTERAPGRSRLQTLLITVSCSSGMGPGDLKTHVFTAGCLARACSKKREFYRHPPRTYSVQYATLREKKRGFKLSGARRMIFNNLIRPRHTFIFHFHPRLMVGRALQAVLPPSPLGAGATREVLGPPAH